MSSFGMKYPDEQNFFSGRPVQHIKAATDQRAQEKTLWYRLEAIGSPRGSVGQCLGSASQSEPYPFSNIQKGSPRQVRQT